MEPIPLSGFDVIIAPDSCKDYRNGSKPLTLYTICLGKLDVFTITPKLEGNDISLHQIAFQIAGAICFKVTVLYKDKVEGRETFLQYEKQVNMYTIEIRKESFMKITKCLSTPTTKIAIKQFLKDFILILNNFKSFTFEIVVLQLPKYVLFICYASSKTKIKHTILNSNIKFHCNLCIF